MNEATTPDPMHADVDAHADAALPAAPITLGGQAFTVTPMKVRQVFPFLKLARPLFAALVARPSSPPSGLPPTAGDPDQGGTTPASLGVTIEAAMADVTWLLDTLETHGPSVIEALAVGIAEPGEVERVRAAIEGLTVVDLVVLLKHFIVVNAGFFVERGISLAPPGGLAQVAAAVAAPPTS